MKSAVSFLRFNALRALERIFGPEELYQLLSPMAGGRAWFKKCPRPLPLPAAIGAGQVIPGTDRNWQNYYLNSTLSFFPERLARPEWLARCSFAGLEELHQTQQLGRPSVIAISHFGPSYLLRLWLQAAGIRAATLISGHASERSYLNRLKDRKRRFPEIPPAFYPHQLREMLTFLDAGNTLVIAVDADSERQMDVPIDAQSSFRMAVGAMRLAARQKARLFPGIIIDEGRWRFRIELGQPVPEDFIWEQTDFVPAGKMVVNQWLPWFQRHPEQCSNTIFDCIRPSVRPPISGGAVLSPTPLPR